MEKPLNLLKKIKRFLPLALRKMATVRGGNIHEILGPLVLELNLKFQEFERIHE